MAYVFTTTGKNHSSVFSSWKNPSWFLAFLPIAETSETKLRKAGSFISMTMAFGMQ